VSKPVLILGAGGHAKVLLEILISLNREIIAIVDPQSKNSLQSLVNCKHYFNDDDVLSFDPKNISLVNGVGSLPDNNLRHKLYKKFSSLGYQFITLISPNAVVSSSAILDDGVQVMAGVIVQAGAHLKSNTIINTGAIIEHDCYIGISNHIAPGVTLSGEVKTGNFVHIGTGANVIQGINIGENTVIGAGAIVTKSVNKNGKIFGFRSIS